MAAKFIPGQAPPETRPPFVAAGERRVAPEALPLPPDKRAGFAVIGLGRLVLDEIIPAFATCKLAKLTALMTAASGRESALPSSTVCQQRRLFGYGD